MKEELLTDALLREFLLGKVDDEERARIENLFLTDPEARERVLVVEQELTEDYLEDGLTTGDREAFLLRYGQTSAQRQQLRIDKAIKDWAVRENASSQIVPNSHSIWDELRSVLRMRPVFAIPVAVALIIPIVVAFILVNNRLKRDTIEQELARLNTPASLREALPQMVSRDLSPITVRGIEEQIEVKKSADTQVVELRLPWIQKERYSMYSAEVRRLNGDESFTIRNLQGEGDGRYLIRLRLPTRILTRGQYQVQLRGFDDAGGVSQVEEYQVTYSTD